MLLTLEFAVSGGTRIVKLVGNPKLVGFHVVLQPCSPKEVSKVNAQYEWNLYKALLISTKRSLDVLRRQICAAPDGKLYCCLEAVRGQILEEPTL